MSRLLLTALLFFAGTTLYSQSTESLSSKSFTTTDEKYISQIQEVYGSNYGSLPEDIKKYLVNLLSDRIHYELIPFNAEKDFPLISSLPLMNSNNPAVTGNVAGTFNANTFRPLHYGFNYFDQNDLWFRIDGTDYVMFVEHFNAKL